MYERKIICLANSRKPPSGRCIAGKVIQGTESGQWIRPVSSRPGHEVSEEERRYDDGSKAKLLDVITIPLEEHVPFEFQTENHRLAEDYYWENDGQANWNNVCDLLDEYDSSFWIDAESTYHGINDKVCESDLVDIECSLKLIQIQRLELVVRSEAGFGGNPARRRVRARFTYGGNQYLLSVTDPEIEELYLKKGDGEYVINDSILCISLSEIWHGYAYRLVASIITQNRC